MHQRGQALGNGFNQSVWGIEAQRVPAPQQLLGTLQANQDRINTACVDVSA